MIPGYDRAGAKGQGSEQRMVEGKYEGEKRLTLILIVVVVVGLCVRSPQNKTTQLTSQVWQVVHAHAHSLAQSIADLVREAPRL